jgi:transposase
MRIKTVSTVKEVLYQDMKGVSQRQIAQSLGISRNTIRNYCNLAVEFGLNSSCSNDELDTIAVKVHDAVYRKARNRPKEAMEAITPFHQQIEEYLAQKWITHKQIHLLLKEKGLRTSSRSIGRYIQQHFPKAIKSTVRLETIAGAEAQVDYGAVGVFNNRKLYAFVMTLSHSRYRYVEFVYSQNAQSWAQSHINAFKFFGAIPNCVLLDNLNMSQLMTKRKMDYILFR